jgi:hypothetical protein
VSTKASSKLPTDYQKIEDTAGETINRMWQDIHLVDPEVVADMVIEILFSSHPVAASAVGPLSDQLLEKRLRLNDDQWKEYVDTLTGLNKLRL